MSSTHADPFISHAQYGAKAIFDDKEAEATAIRYSEQEIDVLLARSAAEITDASQPNAGASFAHAKIWERGGLDDVTVPDETEDKDENLHSFWSSVLSDQQIAEAKRKADEAKAIGRGMRRAVLASVSLPPPHHHDTCSDVFSPPQTSYAPPTKPKKRKKSVGSGSSDDDIFGEDEPIYSEDDDDVRLQLSSASTSRSDVLPFCRTSSSTVTTTRREVVVAAPCLKKRDPRAPRLPRSALRLLNVLAKRSATRSVS